MKKDSINHFSLVKVHRKKKNKKNGSDWKMEWFLQRGRQGFNRQN
jgi:hypothetical protein